MVRETEKDQNVMCWKRAEISIGLLGEIAQNFQLNQSRNNCTFCTLA